MPTPPLDQDAQWERLIGSALPQQPSKGSEASSEAEDASTDGGAFAAHAEEKPDEDFLNKLAQQRADWASDACAVAC